MSTPRATQTTKSTAYLHRNGVRPYLDDMACSNVPYAHTVAWLVVRQQGSCLLDNTPKGPFVLATRKAANGIAWCVPFHHGVDTLPAKLQVQSALNNGEQILTVGMSMGLRVKTGTISVSGVSSHIRSHFNAAIQPANGAVHRLLNPGAWGYVKG